MSRKLLPAIAALVLLLTSCAPATLEPSSAALTPYLTLTPSPTAAPISQGEAADTPLPSPTPFTYTIQAGDTMGELAQKFGVPLDALIAANPSISPNAMPIGATLRIPADENNPTGEATPTPVPFAITQVQCYPTLDGGMWCFALARNDSADALENLSARLSLLSADGTVAAAQVAIPPLNVLPPHASLPLTVFFPPPVPADASPRAQTVWVVAVAYDAAGRVVGFRRWDGGGLQPGGSLPFDLTVASLGSRVTRVELFIEARP